MRKLRRRRAAGRRRCWGPEDRSGIDTELPNAAEIASSEAKHSLFWLRTNGVNTNGAAAKVVNFDRLGKKVCPGTFGRIKVG